MPTPIRHPADQIHYPYDDGQPVAESDFQLNPLIYAVEALRGYFRDREDIYVAGNMFLYYEEGNPKVVVAPDVFVVIGAPRRDRFSYMLWKEPKAPDFVLEVTSRSTRSEDQGPKRGVYAFLGIGEYWQYDPTGDYLSPPLQGFRLVDGNYQPLPAGVAAGGAYSLHSAVLGLDLRLEDGVLWFYETGSGTKLLTYQESERLRREAEARASSEAARRQAAEARVAELEAQLRRLQSGRGDG
ncbi:MAG: Uma2 family endonuclease [Pseudomonadota bacterium]|nr:Uma2 family endonuclease [Pseudomonadota bacterium]